MISLLKAKQVYFATEGILGDGYVLSGVRFAVGRLMNLPGHMAYMRRCPQCGSSDLYPATGAYLGALYRCKGCGYQGAFVVDSEEEMPHPEEPDNNSHQIDIPLWIRILALIFLAIFVWLAVK